MASSDMTGPGGRLTSLRDMPQDIAPPRDLWPSIHAALEEEARHVAQNDALHPNGSQKRAAPRNGRLGAYRLKPSWLQVSAVAAVVASMAVGIWIGRSWLPAGSSTIAQQPPIAINGTAINGTQNLASAAFVTDPRYLRQRAALLRSHDTQLANLPPETRAKVAASLATIRRSMKELEDALGRDPSNTLLQELLVNTYQDEMRVLTTVQEAGSREI